MSKKSLPGDGPWRILSQCPASWHNTIHAACSQKRCICPRALEILPTYRSPLNGGGPWKILQDCPAKRHNTVSAALGRSGAEVQCVCPRALALRPEGLQRGAKYAKNQTRRSTLRALGLPPLPPEFQDREKLPSPMWLRAGPWKILDECPAEGHNTATWSRKPVVERCICPRGAQLFAEYRKKQNEAERQKTAEGTKTSSSRANPKIEKKMPEPDWSKGFCVDDAVTVLKGENVEASKEGIADRYEMKSLCGICPVRQECRDWIRANEIPPGSLGSVYGGLDKWNRQGKDMRLVNGRIRVVALPEGWENEWV
jgi:hypothetical protein